jgi:hypothetical protein
LILFDPFVLRLSLPLSIVASRSLTPVPVCPAMSSESGDVKRAAVVVSDPYHETTVAHAVSRNRDSEIVECNVPQRCKDRPCMLGVDEAGRGPVCGTCASCSRGQTSVCVCVCV